MNYSELPAARTAGIVVQDSSDEVLVYDMESDKAHCLNQTAAAVWKACDGKTSVNDIAEIISSKAGERVPEDLVWLAIDQLSEHNLLERSVQSKFAGESRRSVIKKIGFASMVALPVIASLVAPQSVLASASCVCSGEPGNEFDCPTGGAANCHPFCTPEGVCVPA